MKASTPNIPATPCTAPTVALDLIDTLAGLQSGSSTHLLRHRRDKVVLATQGSYDSLFDTALPGLTLAERLLVALYACRLSNAAALSAHYRARLESLAADDWPEPLALSEAEAGEAGRPERLSDHRMRALLIFTRTLILTPIEGDQRALLALGLAGISTPAVVSIAQLIAFLSYQIRLVASLTALQAAQTRRSTKAP
jgi:uncharacterized protein YciW